MTDEVDNLRNDVCRFDGTDVASGFSRTVCVVAGFNRALDTRRSDDDPRRPDVGDRWYRNAGRRDPEISRRVKWQRDLRAPTHHPIIARLHLTSDVTTAAIREFS